VNLAGYSELPLQLLVGNQSLLQRSSFCLGQSSIQVIE